MRSNNSRLVLLTFVMVAGFVTLLKFRSEDTSAQAASPTMLVQNLAVRTVVTGLVQPTSIAFIGDNDFLVLEKASGRVLRVEDGAVQSVVLDLAVNFASERGLLGIALHPDFPINPGVYLYWTCRTDAPPADPSFPSATECSNDNILGPDSQNLFEVPLLANRVDRFRWTGTQLEF